LLNKQTFKTCFQSLSFYKQISILSFELFIFS
jgi:hypothetical protein